MGKAAKELDFIQAEKLRDENKTLQNKIYIKLLLQT